MDSKAGVLYDINKQCEMQFGTGSKSCGKNVRFFCDWSLYTTNFTNVCFPGKSVFDKTIACCRYYVLQIDEKSA